MAVFLVKMEVLSNIMAFDNGAMQNVAKPVALRFREVILALFPGVVSVLDGVVGTIVIAGHTLYACTMPMGTMVLAEGDVADGADFHALATTGAVVGTEIPAVRDETYKRRTDDVGLEEGHGAEVFVEDIGLGLDLTDDRWQLGTRILDFPGFTFLQVELEAREGKIRFRHNEAEAGIQMETGLLERPGERPAGIPHLVTAGTGEPDMAGCALPLGLLHKPLDQLRRSPRVDGKDKAYLLVLLYIIMCNAAAQKVGNVAYLFLQAGSYLPGNPAAVAAAREVEYHGRMCLMSEYSAIRGR